VPPSLAQHDDLEFHWNSNSEALVWSEQGEPLQGLTGGGEREEWIFPRQWKDGNEHVFYVEMACNTPPPDLYFQLQKADIVAVNQDARQLLFDFRVMRGLRPLVRPLYLQDYLLTRVKTLH
jgi:alpha-mannosidase